MPQEPESMVDIEEIKENLDEEEKGLCAKREFNGPLRYFILYFAFFSALFHLYILMFNPIEPWLFRNYHLVFGLILSYMVYPTGKRSLNRVSIFDVVCIILVIINGVYIYINHNLLVYRMGVVPTTWDFVISLIGIFLVLEMARRTSKALGIISLVFLAYGFVGPYLPGILHHSGFRLERMVTYLYSTQGVFSVPIDVSSKYLVLFLIFGAFLQFSGVGEYIIELSFYLSGQKRGGPAKVGVFSSALLGMMSGSSTGNAMTTGSFTIPLMKKVGYNSRFAAAVESVASTGGQIMPPIMGAGAFIMAELTGLSYTRIMMAAIIPAILYFAAIYWMVDLEAIKLGLKGLPKSDMPLLKNVIKKIHLLIPVIILIAAIFLGVTIMRAAFYGILSSFIVGLFMKETRMGITKIVRALSTGFINTLPLIAMCATAGLVLGMISLTGIAITISSFLIKVGSIHELLPLVLAMIIAIVLGMGMPTTAAYAVAASAVAPGLIRLGIEPLMAHMFVFYYACLSPITPPVCLTSFAAASIAKTDPMKTGFASVRLGIAAYIIPFMFYYAPSLLLMGDLTYIIINTVTAILGVYALASGVQGYYFGKTKLWQSFVLSFVSLLLLTPSFIPDLLGIIILAALLIYQRNISRKIENTLAS